MIAHALLEVVLIDRCQGSFYLVRIKDLTQPIQVGVPLSQHLVNLAAVADLVFNLLVLVVPVGLQGIAGQRIGTLVEDFDQAAIL